MAFILERAERCAYCGTTQREWDPKLGGKRFAYEAVSVHCPGCYARSVASDDTSRLPGVSIELRPTGTPESARRQVLQQRRARARAEKGRPKQR